ncbi:hypothetical protein HY971_00590 [Candidatus Kaiserbacteria bacterium]|nr:hypothetical protein [Candidatus Kaiserbacteria bacterium]
MQNIHEWYLKIKVFGEGWIAEWGIVVIVFLVALASFGLGRLSALEDTKPLVSITEAPTDARPSPAAPGGLYVAARGGSAYYYPWCTGANRINAANKVWFESEAAARKAGYSPAKGCKGL